MINEIVKNKILSTDWNDMSTKVHDNAVEKGWWGKNEQPLESYLMLINCELCEAVEADRNGKNLIIENIMYFHEAVDYLGFLPAFEQTIKGTVEEEMADAIIRMMDLSAARNIDLSRTSYHTVSFINYSNTLKRSFIGVLMETSNIITNRTSPVKLPMDICIANILAYCALQNIDIMFVIEEKMKYNKLRPYMHGGKKY